MSAPLAQDELDGLDRWWRAENYLSVGQIYLYIVEHGEDLPEIRGWRWPAAGGFGSGPDLGERGRDPREPE
jgi:phosphoketolase